MSAVEPNRWETTGNIPQKVLQSVSLFTNSKHACVHDVGNSYVTSMITLVTAALCVMSETNAYLAPFSPHG